MARPFPLLLVIAFTFTLIACGGADEKPATGSQSEAPAVTPAGTAAGASPTAATPQLLEIKAGEYYFEPNQITVQPGVISITLTNVGPERRHTLYIKNQAGNEDLVKSERVEVGQSTRLEFPILEEGTYQLYCSERGHADRGQVGTLTVRRQPGG